MTRKKKRIIYKICKQNQFTNYKNYATTFETKQKTLFLFMGLGEFDIVFFPKAYFSRAFLDEK